MHKRYQGFTLIEIVIVLAIAALIMIVVFFAVAGAQRGQRDQVRKDAANRVLAAAENYRSNMQGVPPSVSTDLDTYVPQGERRLGSTDIIINAAASNPTGGPCDTTGGTTVTQWSIANKDYVAICLEAGIWYTKNN